MNHKVFISYSSENLNEATAVRRSLEDNGITCWMALRDVNPGDEFGNLIDDAIMCAPIVVVIFSKSAALSKWVNSEISVAYEENKVIIPYRIDTTPLKGNIRIMLNHKHWINAHPDYTSKLNDLVNAVSLHIGKDIKNSPIKNVSSQKEYNKKDNNHPKSKIKKIIFAIIAFIILAIFLFSIVKYFIHSPIGSNNNFNTKTQNSETARQDELSDKNIISYEENGKFGYKLKSPNKIIIAAQYDDAENFREGLACVKLDNKYGFIDKTGKEVIPFMYDKLRSFSDGIALVQLNSKYGYIDKTGKEVIPLTYDYIGGFGEGLAVAKTNNKFGYIDKTGKIIIPFKYSQAKGFCEGLASVKINNKCGYIDKTDNIIIPLIYDEAGGFHKGKAKVKLNGETFNIDKNGNKVL